MVFHYDDGVHARAPRSVKWADLEDTDAEDKDCTGTAAGRKEVLESLLVPRASLAASVETGHADGRLGNESQVLGRREGLASAAPSWEPFCVEVPGDPGDGASRTVSSAPALRSPLRDAYPQAASASR